MHEYIARLIKVGVPRRMAAFVCEDFNRRGKLIELAKYIETVEEECNVPQ